jgi:SAM-dependent methyltransferase
MTNQMATIDALNAEDWAGEMGERWLRNLDRFESMLAPIGVALFQQANYMPGQRVIDLGCGGGASAVAIARLVAPHGSVVGVDISPALVAEATTRALQARQSNVRFIAADAATLKVDAPFDRLHSRFGSMFFVDPAAAFRNLGSLLRPGGRADFAVWAPAKDSPWVASMMGILLKHLDLPKPEPRTPGPFALDDPDYFGGLLRQAGFDQLQFNLWRGEQAIGGSGSNAETAVDFVLDSMSIGDLAKEQPPPLRERIRGELVQMFRSHERQEGVMMTAIAWLVSARRS